VLVRLSPGADAQAVTRAIREGLALGVHDRVAMQDILIAKLIATSARQIAMFLVILAIVSAAIVAFIIYTLTLGKLREIAVLKLIGTRNRTIALMILQQALALGLIGFASGRISAHLWAPYFPKFVLLIPEDSLRALALTLVVCALASALAIRAALTVDPAEAIGG
jgi:putative ABC transport system permease protein